MSEDRVTPDSALVLGYIVGKLHGDKEPFLMVAEIVTEKGEIILEPMDDGPQIRVTVREIEGAGK